MSGYFKRMAHLAKVSAIAPRHGLSKTTIHKSVITPDVAKPNRTPNKLNAQLLPSTDPSTQSLTVTATDKTQSTFDSETLTSQPTQSARKSTKANPVLRQTSTNRMAATAKNKANVIISNQKHNDTLSDAPDTERAIEPSSFAPGIRSATPQPLQPARQSVERKVEKIPFQAPESHTQSADAMRAVSLSNTQSNAQRAIDKTTPASNTLESAYTSSPESTAPPIPGVNGDTDFSISPRTQEIRAIETPETGPLVKNIPSEQSIPAQQASNFVHHIKTPAVTQKVDVTIGAINLSIDPEPHTPPPPPALARAPTSRVGGIWSGRRSLARSYVRRV